MKYKYVLSLFALFGLHVLIKANAIEDWCYNPVGDDCRWYKECLARRFPCEASTDAYAIGFGDTICNDFNNQRSEFSDLGKEWIDNTRACLQKQLAPVLTKKTDMSCSDIQKYAFQTHAHCYSDPPSGSPSFCDLPFSDWLRLTWIVKQSFYRETTETVKQMVQILGNCGSKALFG